MSYKVEHLSVTELKSRLIEAAKHNQAKMAPMLYFLREKIKAQGKAGHGFGQWVEEHLEISRRTADRWANEWAVAEGLRKPSKKSAKTFRQMSKGDAAPNPDGNVTVPLSFILTEKEAEQFIAAMDILGEDARRIIYDAVIEAASSRKKPTQAVRTSTFVPEGSHAASSQASRR